MAKVTEDETVRDEQDGAGRPHPDDELAQDELVQVAPDRLAKPGRKLSFEEAMQHTLTENAELYRRLAQ